MISIKMIMIAIAAISASLSMYAIDMIPYSLAADSGEIPIVGGMCPEGHECICTPDTGVFHDLTAQVNINTGC